MDALPNDCIHLIYRHVFNAVINQMNDEFQEYWSVISDDMYADEEYLSKHRTVPLPEPLIVDGAPNYNDVLFHDAMDEYLNSYDSHVDVWNYLATADSLEAHTSLPRWINGTRPSYFGYVPFF